MPDAEWGADEESDECECGHGSQQHAIFPHSYCEAEDCDCTEYRPKEVTVGSE
jgi:hypothetical protein